MPFKHMPGYSKIWIYQADRAIAAHEKQIITESMQEFVNQWTAHGEPVAAAFDIRFDRFLVLAADEILIKVTGCAIDSSVAYIKKLQDGIDIDFFDRGRVAFMTNGVVSTETLNKLKKMIKNGEMPGDTVVFNNAITSKAELSESWMQPLEESWLSR